MSGISQINYSDALAGRINRRPDYNPIGAWFIAQGATYGGSNRFVDADLRLGENHFENVLMIIRSARKQGHQGVEIRLTPESVSAVESRIAEISVLEDADVDSNLYREHRGQQDQVVVKFRSRYAEWLLKIAKSELSDEEYAELSQLIAIRLTRSERETLLTEKALAAHWQRESR